MSYDQLLVLVRGQGDDVVRKVGDELSEGQRISEDLVTRSQNFYLESVKHLDDRYHNRIDGASKVERRARKTVNDKLDAIKNDVAVLATTCKAPPRDRILPPAKTIAKPSVLSQIFSAMRSISNRLEKMESKLEASPACADPSLRVEACEGLDDKVQEMRDSLDLLALKLDDDEYDDYEEEEEELGSLSTAPIEIGTYGYLSSGPRYLSDDERDHLVVAALLGSLFACLCLFLSVLHSCFRNWRYRRCRFEACERWSQLGFFADQPKATTTKAKYLALTESVQQARVKLFREKFQGTHNEVEVAAIVSLIRARIEVP